MNSNGHCGATKTRERKSVIRMECSLRMLVRVSLPSLLESDVQCKHKLKSGVCFDYRVLHASLANQRYLFQSSVPNKAEDTAKKTTWPDRKGSSPTSSELRPYLEVKVTSK